MVVHIGNHQAIGISPTPIEFIEEQNLFISDSGGTRPLVSSCSFAPFSATMEENKRGGPKNMSFVGLSFTNDSIIAFADSKSSIMGENGKLEWDKKRGNSQKIFKTKNFIMVTFGANEFDAGVQSRKRVHLENWVNINISKYETPSAFAKGMYLYMQKMRVNIGKNRIAFIAGYREKNVNYWDIIYITPENLKITTETEKQMHAIYGGDERYIRYFDKNSELLEGDTEEIRKNIEMVIKRFDEEHTGEYNPVGCPVVTEEFFL